MADTKITGLTELTTASGDDVLPIVESPGGTPATKKITLDNLALSHGHSSISNEWTGGGGSFAVNSTTKVDLFSITTDLAASGDDFLVEAWGQYLNNSGAAANPSWVITINGWEVETSTASINSSATNETAMYIAFDFIVQTGGGIAFSNHRHGTIATSGGSAAGTIRQGWEGTVTDYTGSNKTITVSMKSTTATATQTLRLLAYRVQKN